MNQNDTTLNSLPVGWKWVKLGEIFKTTSGGTPSRRVLQYYDGQICWVKSGELNQNIILDTEEKISQEAIENSSAKVFPKGTLLIALYGATIGKLAFLGINAATNQAVCGIFDNGNDSSKFLYYYLLFKRPELIKIGTGGAQPNISQDVVKKIDLPLPPLSIQTQIVEKLEALLSALDQGKAQLLTAQAQLKTYRQAVLKYAFEGKLTGGSEGWKWVKLGDILKLRSGNGLTSKNMLEKGFPVYGGNGISGFYSEFMFEKSELILGRVGAKCGVVHLTKPKSWVTDNALIVDFNENVNRNFLYWSLTQLNLNKYSVSTAQPVISGAKIYPLEINLPPLSIQQKIVSEIESRLSVCDKLEETIKVGLLQSETLRQSVLKRAFEGRLL